MPVSIISTADRRAKSVSPALSRALLRAPFSRVRPARAGLAAPADAYVPAVTASPTAARPSTRWSVCSPSARCRPCTTTSRISPKANRSPASVPEKPAMSSISPVRKPLANRPARCVTERDSAAASSTRLNDCIDTGRSCASARCAKLCARSMSPSFSAAAISRSTSSGSPATALRTCNSLSTAGSSAAAKIATASRAFGQTTASAAAQAARLARLAASRSSAFMSVSISLPEQGPHLYRRNLTAPGHSR